MSASVPDTSDPRSCGPSRGLPPGEVALAHLEDRIFEGLAAGPAREWIARVASTIEPGSDVSRVADHFLAWLMTDEVPRHFDATAWPVVAAAVAVAADLRRRAAEGEVIRPDSPAARERVWVSGSTSAVAGARAADAAARAAESAMQATPDSAATAASWTAHAAKMAATGGPSEAEAADAAAWGRMGDRLIALLAAAPVGASDHPNR